MDKTHAYYNQWWYFNGEQNTVKGGKMQNREDRDVFFYFQTDI